MFRLASNGFLLKFDSNYAVKFEWYQYESKYAKAYCYNTDGSVMVIHNRVSLSQAVKIIDIFDRGVDIKDKILDYLSKIDQEDKITVKP